MSKIQTLLQQIQTAVYGKDVRQSIHDSIKECYDDVTNSKTLADKSIIQMDKKISACDISAANANAKASLADTAASNANVKAALAQTAANTANASAAACDDAVSAIPNQVTQVFAGLGLALIDGKLCVEVERE